MLEFKVAVASCCSIKLRPRDDQPAWKQIRDARPDLLLLLGDNVYMHHSFEGENLWDHTTLEQRYREQFDVTDFEGLLQETAHMAIWDDHDFGVNDAKGAECSAQDVQRTTERFRRWMHRAINLQGAAKIPGTIFGSETISGVRFIALDVRTLRTSPGLGATVLGSAQRDRLLAELAEHHDKPIVIASGSCLSRGDSDERLLAYAEFREVLLPAMEAHGRVVFLGGDIHFNAYVEHNGAHEVITSGVAQKVGEPAFETNNWAMLTFKPGRLQVNWHGSRAKEFDRATPQADSTAQHRALSIDTTTWKRALP